MNLLEPRCSGFLPLASVLALLTAWAPGIVHGELDFDAPHSVFVGAGSRYLVAADFDDNGSLDLAVARASFDNVTIVLNECSGFGNPVSLATGSPAELATGDFDDDGDVDILGVFNNPGQIRLLRNNGAGSFSVLPGIPIAGVLFSLATGDFDDNGTLDAAVATSTPGEVHVFSGDGNGGFILTDSLLVGDALREIAAADVTGDSLLDLVVARAVTDSVELLEGDGVGGFAATTSIPVGDFPAAVTTADFDGNGVSDLAVGNRFSDDVSVLLADGLGGFSLAGSFPVFFPLYVTTHDIDENGVLDLVVLNGSGSQILFGLGGGDFLPSPETVPAATPQHSVVGDFDGDSHLDVVMTNSSDNLLLNPGDGSGGFRGVLEADTDLNTLAMRRADVTGDGIDDILISGFDSSADVRIFRGLGNGSYVEEAPVLLTGTVHPYDFRLADITEDGILDLVLVAADNFVFEDDEIAVLPGDGIGGFGAPMLAGVGDWPRDLAVGDFDEDGHLDVAVCHSQANYVSLLFGDGTGQFARTDMPLGNNAHQIETADLDQDGHLDLVVDLLNGPTLLFGSGTGTFGSPIAFPFSSQKFAIRDLDEDGDLDLLIADYGSAKTYFGDGAGGFQTSTVHPEIRGEGFALADFDGDGHLDVAAPGTLDDSVTLFLGNGTGEYGRFLSLSIRDASAAVAPDSNLDGLPDLVVATFDGPTLTLITNISDGDPDLDDDLIPDACQTSDFIRGDANGDGAVMLDDAVTVLQHLFAQGVLACGDAADFDDDGSLLLNDPIALLQYQFSEGAPPAAPFPGCGPDAGATLGCTVASACP